MLFRGALRDGRCQQDVEIQNEQMRHEEGVGECGG